MKLLATDFDGTLKFSDSVMESDLAAINEWRARGDLFAIVTGRSLASIKKEARNFNIPVDFFITNNGGMVFDADGNELLSSTLDTITAIDLMYLSHDYPDIVSFSVNDGKVRHKIDVHPQLEDHRYAHVAQDWTEEEIMDSGRFAQIVFSCSTPEAALELSDQLNQYFGSNIHAYANNFCVDIVPKGTSKATGLEFVQSYTDVDDDDVFCMGDSYNDIPMLSAYEHSATQAMAPAAVMESAPNSFVSLEDYVHAIDNGEV